MSSKVVLALLVALCAPVPSGLGGLVPRDLWPPEDRSHEIARIQAHLEGAETLLLGRDTSTLTSAQRAARARCIANLSAYRRRGIFPHNHERPDVRTPVFVDEHGTRCAMAFLIERSGDGPLVSRIARTRNLARIRALARDPALAAWLEHSGLTLDEAARIQPEYQPHNEDDPADHPAVRVAAGMGAGIAATGVALNVSIGKSQDARNARGLVGVTLGLLGAGLGVPALSKDGGVRALGALDIGMGLTSFGLGLRQLRATGDKRQRAAHSMAPAIWRDGDGNRGVAVVMRF